MLKWEIKMWRWFQVLNTYIGATSLRCKLKCTYPIPSTKKPHWCSLKHVGTLFRISIGTLKHSKERGRGAHYNRWSSDLYYDWRLSKACLFNLKAFCLLPSSHFQYVHMEDIIHTWLFLVYQIIYCKSYDFHLINILETCCEETYSALKRTF